MEKDYYAFKDSFDNYFEFNIDHGDGNIMFHIGDNWFNAKDEDFDVILQALTDLIHLSRSVEYDPTE